MCLTFSYLVDASSDGCTIPTVATDKFDHTTFGHDCDLEKALEKLISTGKNAYLLQFITTLSMHVCEDDMMCVTTKPKSIKTELMIVPKHTTEDDSLEAIHQGVFQIVRSSKQLQYKKTQENNVKFNQYVTQKAEKELLEAAGSNVTLISVCVLGELAVDTAAKNVSFEHYVKDEARRGVIKTKTSIFDETTYSRNSQGVAKIPFKVDAQIHPKGCSVFFGGPLQCNIMFGPYTEDNITWYPNNGNTRDMAHGAASVPANLTGPLADILRDQAEDLRYLAENRGQKPEGTIRIGIDLFSPRLHRGSFKKKFKSLADGFRDYWADNTKPDGRDVVEYDDTSEFFFLAGMFFHLIKYMNPLVVCNPLLFSTYVKCLFDFVIDYQSAAGSKRVHYCIYFGVALWNLVALNHDDWYTDTEGNVAAPAPSPALILGGGFEKSLTTKVRGVSITKNILKIMNEAYPPAMRAHDDEMDLSRVTRINIFNGTNLSFFEPFTAFLLAASDGRDGLMGSVTSTGEQGFIMSYESLFAREVTVSFEWGKTVDSA
jgi:hypothetical protein